MTLQEYAAILLDPSLEFLEEGNYANSDGIPGTRAYYRLGNRYYWYSVSNSQQVPTSAAVAEAITRGVATRAQTFGEDGFEATVFYKGHAYMVNMSRTRP